MLGLAEPLPKKKRSKSSKWHYGPYIDIEARNRVPSGSVLPLKMWPNLELEANLVESKKCHDSVV